MNTPTPKILCLCGPCTDERTAWDRYSRGYSAQLADELLQERRQRWGTPVCTGTPTTTQKTPKKGSAPAVDPRQLTIPEPKAVTPAISSSPAPTVVKARFLTADELLAGGAPEPPVLAAVDTTLDVEEFLASMDLGEG